MNLQSGNGYGFTSSGYGVTLDVGSPFSATEAAPPTSWEPYDNGDNTFSMYPGTINSTIPCIGAIGSANLLTAQTSPRPRAPYNFDVTGTCYIYLRAGPQTGGAIPIWPSPNFNNIAYPTVLGFNQKQDDSDTYGHILLAIAQKDPEAPSTPPPPVRFTRFVTNSVWSERHKYTQPNASIYLFYRV